MHSNKRIDIKRATNREILAFSLLPLGFFFIDCTVYTVINFYMTDVLKLSMSLVSIILLGTKAWDAINDPIMGQIVERTRTKWGKCRPYLLWVSIPFAVTTALLSYLSNSPKAGTLLQVTAQTSVMQVTLSIYSLCIWFISPHTQLWKFPETASHLLFSLRRT